MHFTDECASWTSEGLSQKGKLSLSLHRFNRYLQGGESCFPRADVIYIYYSGSGKDRWAIEYIEVTTFLAFGPRDKDQ